MFLEQLVHAPKNITGQNDLVVDSSNYLAAFEVSGVGGRELSYTRRLDIRRRCGIEQLLRYCPSAASCEREHNKKNGQRAHRWSAPSRTDNPVRQRTRKICHAAKLQKIGKF